MIARKFITIMTRVYTHIRDTIGNIRAQRRLEQDALKIINNRLGTNYRSLKEVPSGHIMDGPYSEL